MSTSFRPTADQATLEAVFNKVFSVPDEELEACLHTIFAQNLTATVRGQKYEGFNAYFVHLQGVRSRAQGAQLRIVRFLTNGREFAEQHFIEATVEGQPRKSKGFVFGEVDEEGRIVTWEEAFAEA